PVRIPHFRIFALPVACATILGFVATRVVFRAGVNCCAWVFWYRILWVCLPLLHLPLFHFAHLLLFDVAHLLLPLLHLSHLVIEVGIVLVRAVFDEPTPELPLGRLRISEPFELGEEHQDQDEQERGEGTEAGESVPAVAARQEPDAKRGHERR